MAHLELNELSLGQMKEEVFADLFSIEVFIGDRLFEHILPFIRGSLVRRR
jgi:hypothetical protein